jgi:hypothetical protein
MKPPWYKLKTIQAAIITGIIGVAMAVVGEGVVNEQVAGGILVAVALLNTVLAMVGKESV